MMCLDGYFDDYFSKTIFVFHKWFEIHGRGGSVYDSTDHYYCDDSSSLRYDAVYYGRDLLSIWRNLHDVISQKIVIVLEIIL
jgi:hypothetical protein